MSKLTLPYRLAALFATSVGVFLLLGSFGHLGATWPMLQGVSLPSVLLLLPGVLLLAVGLFNVLASWGLWNGKRPVYSFAVGLNGLLLAYIAFLLARGVPGHPLWFFTLMVAAYLLLLAVVRFRVGRQPESLAT